MKKYSLKHKSWEVPSFNYAEFAGRKSDYCLIIPVINEGERIRRELKRVLAAKIPQKCDVIIADGGSKDGSLQESYLKKHKVRALLVKTGPGRLSAQMRMAMAYALEQGYKGLIFIDGNDKDDPAATHAFVKKLGAGFDHIQGSRFLKGGKEANTPFERYWGLRLVHAPMISLFSGKWQTDTSNGFRAYSRKLLLDPKVNPFRDILSEYEMHYYLAVRAPRLGYRIAEVPVTREYPADGKVPTKISPIRGMAKLMWSTLKACLGLYNPKK